MSDPSSLFSNDTIEKAEQLVSNAVAKNTVPITLGAQFLVALSQDLDGTEADLSGRPISEIGGIGYNVLKRIFNDAQSTEGRYLVERSHMLNLGLGMSASFAGLSRH